MPFVRSPRPPGRGFTALVRPPFRPILVLLGGLFLPFSSAQDAVRLPPFIVKDSLLGPRWQIARTDRFEVLSRTNARKARAMVEAYHAGFAKLEVVLPQRFIATHDEPIKLIFYDESLWPRSTQDEVAAMLSTLSDRVPKIDLRSNAGRRDSANYSRLTRPPDTHFDQLREPWITSEPVHVPYEKNKPAPSAAAASSVFFTDMRLTDLDEIVIFSLAPVGYNHRFSISLRSPLVAHLMGKRTPSLPPWFLNGFLEVYREIEFDAHGLRLPPLELLSPEETRAASKDSTVLTASFVPIIDLLSDRAPPVDYPLRNRQLGLFIRWVLDPRGGDRANALWTLLDNACLNPVDETALQNAFHLTPAEIDQALLDYAPFALRRSVQWDQPGEESINLRLDTATSADVARIRGDWERLETDWVRHNHQELLESYAKKAQQTLHRGGGRGDRDPHLLVNRALFAFEAGELADAAQLFETALATDVILRPRAYLALAQAHWARWQDDNRGLDDALPATEAAPWLDLLREAARGSPKMSDVFHTYLAIIEARRQPYAPEDLAFLLRGIEAFPRDTTLAIALAERYLAAGRIDSARELLARTIALGGRDSGDPRWTRLQIEMPSSADSSP